MLSNPQVYELCIIALTILSILFKLLVKSIKSLSDQEPVFIVVGYT